MVKYSLHIARLDEGSVGSTPSQGHTDSYHVPDFHFLHEISGLVITYALPCSRQNFLEVIYTELTKVRHPTRRLDVQTLTADLYILAFDYPGIRFGFQKPKLRHPDARGMLWRRWRVQKGFGG